MTPRELLELRGLAGYGVFPEPRAYKGFPDQVIRVETEPISLPRPHYSDDRYRNVQLMYLNPSVDISSLDWDYTDRFQSWDAQKYSQAIKAASKHHFPSVSYFEAFITSFYGGDRVLKAVAGGVNHSDGYEYFVLGTIANDR